MYDSDSEVKERAYTLNKCIVDMIESDDFQVVSKGFTDALQAVKSIATAKFEYLANKASGEMFRDLHDLSVRAEGGE